jgi:hypothetical protein
MSQRVMNENSLKDDRKTFMKNNRSRLFFLPKMEGIYNAILRKIFRKVKMIRFRFYLFAAAGVISTRRFSKFPR